MVSLPSRGPSPGQCLGWGWRAVFPRELTGHGEGAMTLAFGFAFPALPWEPYAEGKMKL